jgi:cystathionine gamma-synthase
MASKDKKKKYQGFSSAAVHAGEIHWRRSLTTPIVQASTFTFEDMAEVKAYTSGKHDHYEYGRYGNPTREAVEAKLAELEGAEVCLLTDCGMSAVTYPILALVKQGDHVIFTDDAYKKTLDFANNWLPKYGVDASIVPMGDYEAMGAAVRDGTVLLVSESPTNPYLNIADTEKVVEIAKRHNLTTMIDSTFGTPYNQKPLEYGIDIVVHSATKYLGGHNDLLAGAILCSEERMETIRDLQKTIGGIPDPHGCYLLIRGLKSLAVRMEWQNRSALTVAEFLEKDPRVRKTYYPMLPSHHHHDLAKKYMRGGGGVVTFQLDADLEKTLRFFDALELCSIAPSLGGPESLLTHPAAVSYYNITREERYAIGITDDLCRLAVGFEEPEDIIADLDQAMKAIR